MHENKTDTKNALKIDGLCFYYEEERQLKNTDYDFTADGKTYTEMFFRSRMELDLYDKKRYRYLDEDGNTVVMLIESIPVFDSSDYMYDSQKVLYITERAGRYVGFFLREGYHIAKAIQYLGLTCADEKTEKALNEVLYG